MVKLFAPFAVAEVSSLNAYQLYGGLPQLCRNRDDGNHVVTNDLGVLIATAEGWTCARCSFTQDWAFTWMTDWSWRNLERGGNDNSIGIEADGSAA